MKIEDFVAREAGRLVPTILDQQAFVPSPLPPELDNAAITIELAEATAAVGELNGACRRLQNSNILVRPLQRQEALTSSAMEGTYTTADRLVLAEAGVGKEIDDSTKEVGNYIRAINHASHLLATLPISHRVIKAAHIKLLEGLSTERGSKKRPGEYKTDQNFIGSRSRRIEDARFVPPPPEDTIECMDKLESYLNRETTSKAEKLIDLALVHYQIETIHPFGDGNGRLGRMLVTLMAVTSDLLEKPVLYISPAIESDKDQYIDLMYNVSSKGQWTEWLNFFFGKVTQSCYETIRTIDRLIDLQEKLRDKASQSIRTANAISLIDHLFEFPATTIRQAATNLDVTYNAAQSLIQKLEKLDILFEVTGEYPKTYIAWEIIHDARTDAEREEIERQYQARNQDAE